MESKMFKNLLIAAFVLGLSMGSVSALAASAESHPEANVISATSNVKNQALLLQVPDNSVDEAIGESSQPHFQSAEGSESTLSTGWLFAVALLWFVILSNRRNV
jgi:hypothetical protein